MARAMWNGVVIAESETFERVEGNVYFPADSVKKEHLEKSSHNSFCGWKGTARYYHVVVDGDRNTNAAWYYPDPKPDAAAIKDHVAFWNGVTVEE